MKKQAINYSWPAAILSDFAKDEVQGNITRGKLKVFYIGETADHRMFGEEFAREVVKTLPYTPVVSYYDEEEEDFVGHAAQQQIYGIVDPREEPSFEVDDEGKTWCVVDVVFYTERPDKVGEIAKKIAGHKHSLELDPKTVKYTVNYDERKHFKNIEFTAGTFVGVSVLGKNQKPAFTGSTFFSEGNSDFEEKMLILKNYCENEQINNPTQNGGVNMDLNEFMKLSWGEITLKVDEAISKEYGNDAYTCIVDAFEDSVIVRFHYYIEGTCKLMRVNYSCDENGIVTLGDVREVHVTYEDIEAVATEDKMAVVEEDTTNTVTDATEIQAEEMSDDVTSTATTEEEVVVDASNVEDAACGDSDEDEDEKKKDNIENASEDTEVASATESETVISSEESASTIATEASMENIENSAESAIIEDTSTVDTESSQNFTSEISKVSVEDNNEATTTVQEDNSSFTSFAESERAEFEALKREKKVNLLNSYKESLSEEDYNDFLSNIDSFETKDLELELLKKYKQSSNENEQIVRVFNYSTPDNNSSASSGTKLDELVRKYLR